MTLQRAPYIIALLCVFVPLISVHLTATIAMLFGNVHTCVPYWSDCYSISATGRGYPEFFVFKALLIPSAVFMCAYWLLLHHWVKGISDGEVVPTVVTVMGVIASIALVVYSVTLGAVGEPYALARRIGVVFYFAFSSFGHLILLHYLDKIDTHAHGIVRQQNRLTISSVTLIGTAIASAFIGLIWEEAWDRWENAYEWWFGLLMISLFYHVASMWKITNFQLASNFDDKQL